MSFHPHLNPLPSRERRIIGNPLNYFLLPQGEKVRMRGEEGFRCDSK